MNKLIVDFFRNTPLYIKDNKIEESNFNLLQQTYSVDGNNYFLNCENSRVIRIDNNTYTSTFYSEMNTFREKNQITTKNNEGLDLLLKILSTKLNSDNLKFLFPDIFNEFDLSKLYKILKRGYKKVESMPKSIATVFYYENIKKLNKRILEEKKISILVIDLIGEELTLTLIKPTEINETKLKDEIIWERYPTVIEKISEEKFDALYNKIGRNECNIFNLTRKNEEKIKLKIVKKNKIFDIGNDLNINSIDVSSYINKFLENHKEIIEDYNQNTELHVISLSHNLEYNIEKNYKIEKKNILDSEVLMGYDRYLEKYEKLIGKSETIDLWKDYLPGLAIKLLFGKFDLIGDEGLKIIPKIGKKEEISIKNTFTIVKNESNVYRFPLIKTGISQKVNIEAVLKPQVKLKENVECKLRLTYTYGSEKPYELIFEPLDSNIFSELKVKWEKKKEENLSREFLPFQVKELYKKKEVFKDLEQKFKKFNNFFSEEYSILNLKNSRIKKLKEEEIYNEKNSKKIFYRIDYLDDFNNIQQVIVTKKVDKSKNSLGNEMRYDILFLKKNYNQKSTYINISNWKDNELGKYYYDETNNIIFYSTNYIIEDDIYDSYIKYSLASKKDKKGRYIAKLIHSSKYDMIDKICEVKFLFNNYVLYQLSTLFRQYVKEDYSKNSNKIYQIVKGAKENILKLYYISENTELQNSILYAMSISADIFGEQFKNIYYNLIEKYKYKENFIDEIGYSLTRFSKDEMKEMLEKLWELDKNKVINVLSKNVWFSNELIKRLKKKEILEYFKTAVDVLEGYSKTEITHSNKEYLEKNISNTLMFILGLLRRRSKGIKNRMLSMSNPDFERCYQIIEKLSKNNLNIKSFLNLRNKEGYDNIPSLLVITAKYLTGHKIDIKIDTDDENK
jgi:hypothetical protein